MRCHMCEYVCDTSLKSLICHWRVFHKFNEKSIYICTVYNCDRKYSSLNSFKRHFELEHATYFASKKNKTKIEENSTRSFSYDNTNSKFTFKLTQMIQKNLKIQRNG